MNQFVRRRIAEVGTRWKGEKFAHHIEMHVNVIFMPKIKWNVNKILYNDEVFELVLRTELKWPS